MKLDRRTILLAFYLFVFISIFAIVNVVDGREYGKIDIGGRDVYIPLGHSYTLPDGTNVTRVTWKWWSTYQTDAMTDAKTTAVMTYVDGLDTEHAVFKLSRYSNGLELFEIRAATIARWGNADPITALVRIDKNDAMEFEIVPNVTKDGFYFNTFLGNNPRLLSARHFEWIEALRNGNKMLVRVTYERVGTVTMTIPIDGFSKAYRVLELNTIGFARK